jgi:hypothetical protein
MHTPGPDLPEHCASLVQATQTFTLVSQMGFTAALQSSLVAHSTQRPESASQAGVAVGHPASTKAHDTHTWLTEQTGAPPLH